MNFDNIKELIDIVNKSDLTCLELSMDNVSVKMSKNSCDFTAAPIASGATVSTASTAVTMAEVIKEKVVTNETRQEVATANVDLSTGNIIKSPIVGTFYASGGPSKPNFVTKGDKVKVGDVLCIVEAMKIMNEIVSEYEGEISEILVENEQLVEYGQPLFKIV